MTKPKTTPKTKSKNKYHCRKDRNDPKNMNTKSLYLMALDYKSNTFSSEPLPYSFSNNTTSDYIVTPNACNTNDLVFSNLQKKSEYIFNADNSATFYKCINAPNTKSEETVKFDVLSINNPIDANIIKDYLTNITKREYFYKL